MSLKNKLLLAFIVLIVIPLFFMGVFTFIYSEQLLKQKYSEQTRVSLKAIGGNIAYFFKELDKLSESSMTGSTVQDMLKGSPPTHSEAGQIIMKNKAEMQLSRILFQHQAISFIVLYGENGAVYKATRNDATTFRPVSYEKFRAYEAYRRANSLGGRPLWIGPYENSEIATENPPLFTQIRQVKSLESFDPIGTMVMQFKADDLETMLQSYIVDLESEDPSRYLIVNRDGRILLDSQNQIAGDLLDRYTKESVRYGHIYRSNRNSFKGQDSLISRYDLDLNGWYLVSVKSWSSLTKESVRVTSFIAVVVSICILLAILFNLFFVGRVARTIIRVVNKMRLVEQGHLDTRIRVIGRDETATLAQSFNRMTERIDGLLQEVTFQQERKQHAEMMLMQAQIKPHFLFNTLESINALAAQNEGGKIMLMVRRLGNLLRISMEPKEQITLRQEKTYLESYLEIQKYRFEDLFTYEIDIPEELGEETVLKLTLQPLVENCIQHGFDGIDVPGRIEVKARAEEGRIVLTVKDNGKGIPAEKLQQFAYSRSAEAANQAESEGSTVHMGLGVLNVADRLRIHYGSAYGLYLCSHPGEGTVIRCIIPKRKAELP